MMTTIDPAADVDTSRDTCETVLTPLGVPTHARTVGRPSVLPSVYEMEGDKVEYGKYDATSGSSR